MPERFSGELLRKERKRLGKTQRWLADKVFLSERYIRDLEHGVKRNPSAELLYRFSHALNIHVDDLMIMQKGDDNHR